MKNVHAKKIVVSALFATSVAISQASHAWSLSSLFGGSTETSVDSTTTAGDAIKAIIEQEQKDCLEGKEGTVGAAVKDAVTVHVKIASAAPNTESLFSMDNPCFSGLLQLNDLSFAIPSMSSVVGAVTSALEKYATQKVCTLVKEQVSAVTTPINNLINEINTQFGGNAINGMIGGALSQIDPQLGSQYVPPPAGTQVTVNTNGLAMSALTFENPQVSSNSSPTQRTANTPSPSNTAASPAAQTPATATPPAQTQTSEPSAASSTFGGLWK